jgi:T4 RnlA family RNA ligase
MNLQTLHKYYEEGWLIKQTHPTLPLTIWNYSQTTQYEGKWDEVTLQCRGLVTDDKGNVVARPFKKFFNMEEGKHTPTKDFEVYEKMDGSLGILFHYEGEWIFASRGSFTSEQATKGRELLNKYDLDILSPGYTYLFEIIYDANRIVVDYTFEDVVMLGCIKTTDGDECDIWDDYYASPFELVMRYDSISDYSTLKEKIGDNEEGFVVRFSNGDRMKIKGEEYIRLHKIMTEVSTKSVWEILSNGGSMEGLLKDVPDEFYSKIKEYENELITQFKKIKHKYEWYFSLMPKDDRKKFAVSVRETEFPSILFAMLDGKDVEPIIWKIIQPEFRKL